MVLVILPNFRVGVDIFLDPAMEAENKTAFFQPVTPNAA
jgi:hypothetical protein